MNWASWWYENYQSTIPFKPWPIGRNGRPSQGSSRRLSPLPADLSLGDDVVYSASLQTREERATAHEKKPLSNTYACDIVGAWLERPNVVVINARDSSWSTRRRKKTSRGGRIYSHAASMGHFGQRPG